MKYSASCALLALAVLCGCGDDETNGPAPTPPSFDQLQTRGANEVGFRELEFSYSAAESGQDRTLPVRVWYPAVNGGEDAADYSVAGLVSVPTDGALAAPQLAEGGPFPLAVYSHGSGGEGLLAYPFAELFASHGWVVVAPSHVGNTVNDGIAMTFDPFPRITLNRPADISALLDWLAAGPAGDPLAGNTSTDKVFLFGHSFGAFTTFAAGGVDLDLEASKTTCGSSTDCDLYDDPAFAAGFGDPRIAAISPQAPALVPNFGAGELAALELPTLLQSGLLDITTTHAAQAQPSWDGLDHPGDIWLNLQKGGHLSFISICGDLDINTITALQPNAEEDGCGPDFTPVSELMPVLGGYMLGFARQHVLGESQWAEVLAGDSQHPDIDVSHR